jgi:hypothetical protein
VYSFIFSLGDVLIIYRCADKIHTCFAEKGVWLKG